MKNKKTKLFSFHIFIDLLEKSKQLAEKERRSISSVINQALDKFFELRIAETEYQHRVEWEDGNPKYSGKAKLGIAITESKWQIEKLTYDSRGQARLSQYPNGDKRPRFKWSERDNYSYRRMR